MCVCVPEYIYDKSQKYGLTIFEGKNKCTFIYVCMYVYIYQKCLRRVFCTIRIHFLNIRARGPYALDLTCQEK